MKETSMNEVKNVLRLVLAVIFAVGAAANANRLSADPGAFSDFASVSFLPFYRTLWTAWVFPNIQVWVGIVIVLEAVIALLLLWKGRLPRIGMLLAAAFMVFLIPFWWLGGSLVNLAFALVFAWLLRSEYPDTIPDLLRGKGRVCGE
jgi:hypothetical protein